MYAAAIYEAETHYESGYYFQDGNFLLVVRYNFKVNLLISFFKTSPPLFNYSFLHLSFFLPKPFNLT